MRIRLPLTAALVFTLVACERAPSDATDTTPGRFRAVGQEPGWFAVVSGAPPTLHVEADYGATKLDVTRLRVTKSGWSGVDPDGIAVALSFDRAACQDAMSGEPFDAAATLTVADKTYRGCGNFLP